MSDWRYLLAQNRATLLSVLFFVVMFAIYASNHPAGFSANVVQTAANKGVLLALVAMAQTFVVITAGIASAFFINDTICLALTPLVIATIRPLRLNHTPFLLAIALAANVGGAMAITGNPQNMMIGSFSQIPYRTFAAALAPFVTGVRVEAAALMQKLFGDELRREAAISLGTSEGSSRL